MLIFISGPVRSGKSSLGEQYAVEMADKLDRNGRIIYLATAQPCDDEMRERIAKHRADRSGKGFIEIEKQRDVGKIAEKLNQSDTVLLDCLGNLTANELFDCRYEKNILSCKIRQSVVKKIFEDLMQIERHTGTLIVISNEIFSDGVEYDESTRAYMQILGALHVALAKTADRAIECAFL